MSEHNPFPGENNTGHIWDDNLRELANPVPGWWLKAFYASIAFVVCYWLIYPAIPLVSNFSRGVTGWTAMGEYYAAMDEVKAIRKPYEDKILNMSAKEMLADAEISAYVEASGKVLFGDKCSACHGKGGSGNVGFPVLADDDWLHGGTIENIQTTITNGRQPMMPAHEGTLSAAEIDTLANYVVGLSQGKDDAAGKALFTGKAACFACHGSDAKGMTMMGSANLTDGIWRFNEADKLASAKRTITYGVNAGGTQTRNAQMPSFKHKLTDSEVKKLAVYVHKFGGGK